MFARSDGTRRAGRRACPGCDGKLHCCIGVDEGVDTLNSDSQPLLGTSNGTFRRSDRWTSNARLLSSRKSSKQLVESRATFACECCT